MSTYIYQIASDRKMACLVYQGKLMLEKLTKSVQEMLQDPEFEHVSTGIIDLTQIDTSITFDEFERHIHQICIQNLGDRPLKWAIVVPESATLDLARMSSALKEIDLTNAEFKVFKDKIEAIDWLEI